MYGNSLEQIVVELADQMRSHFYGKYRGIVSDTNDPEGMGRIRAQVPEIYGTSVESPWALPCSPVAGDDIGQFTIPETGSGVFIEFEAGDPSRPIWTGCYWGSGQAPKDESGGAATPAVKIIKSQSGLMVRMNDDQQNIAICDKDGKNILSIEVGAGKITIKGASKAVVEAPQIELVENATHPVVFGDELMTYLNQIVNIYLTHMHPGQTTLGIPVTPAPPQPPMPAPTPSLLSTKVKSG